LGVRSLWFQGFIYFLEVLWVCVYGVRRADEMGLKKECHPPGIKKTPLLVASTRRGRKNAKAIASVLDACFISIYGLHHVSVWVLKRVLHAFGPESQAPTNREPSPSFLALTPTTPLPPSPLYRDR